MGNNGISFMETKVENYGLKREMKNTKFLKKMANAHRRRNYLDKVRVNDVMLSEDTVIKEEVVDGFQSLLSELKDWRPNINGIYIYFFFENLGRDNLGHLETPFFEVFSALSNLCGDKVLGLDGFSMDFWQFN